MHHKTALYHKQLNEYREHVLQLKFHILFNSDKHVHQFFLLFLINARKCFS